jgi:Tfp pilus assembly protein PilN
VREPEFLPRWYRQAARQRWLIVVQSCVTAAAGVALCAWVGVVGHHVATRRAEIAGFQAQIDRRQSQFQTLATLQARRREWAAQVRRMNALGLEADAERIVQAIDAAMPRDVTLVDLRIDPGASGDAAATRPASDGEREARAGLHVTLDGVAPDERQLTAFLAGLSGVPRFDGATVTRVNPSTQAGRTVQQFEITFRVRLDPV